MLLARALHPLANGYFCSGAVEEKRPVHIGGSPNHTSFVRRLAIATPSSGFASLTRKTTLLAMSNRVLHIASVLDSSIVAVLEWIFSNLVLRPMFK